MAIWKDGLPGAVLRSGKLPQMGRKQDRAGFRIDDESKIYVRHIAKARNCSESEAWRFAAKYTAIAYGALPVGEPIAPPAEKGSGRATRR